MSLPPSIHASAVLVGEAGVLIRGASGSGKSSLLLALVDGDRSARLVADDRVILVPANGRLLAAAPAELAGLVEIRGQGIARRRFVSPVVLRLVVDLLPPDLCPRLPGVGEDTAPVAEVRLPCLKLPVAAPDGALRLRLALVGLCR